MYIWFEKIWVKTQKLFIISINLNISNSSSICIKNGFGLYIQLRKNKEGR